MKSQHTNLSHFRASFSAVALLASLTSFSSSLAAGNLVINSMHSTEDAKPAFDAVVEKFKQENKDINVTVNTTGHEAYKVRIKLWLPNDAPDVATWYAGNLAKPFVDLGLVEPIDDVWKPVEAQFGEGAKAASTFNGKKYLMATNYYNWGFYYRKDLFQKAGITATPKTWPEFLTVVDKLQAAKLTPITIGTKEGWTTGGWFDFLNMRTNGFAFHTELLAGKHSFTDDKVKKAVSYWTSLAEKKAFPPNASALTWQEASALMYQGKAGMYLMGNFILGTVPEEQKKNIGFFGFPQIDEKIPASEVAPTDVYFIPSKAKNKDNAKKFLSFMARADVQTLYTSLNKTLPTNTQAKLDFKDKNGVKDTFTEGFAKESQDLLNKAAGLSQFFDRDANPEVAKVGMDGMVELMRYPTRVDAVLKKVEATQQRINASSKKK